MAGVLYGVSVGPGDPELITVKAVRILEKCGTIAVPRTMGENTLALSIAEQAADLSGKRIVYLDFPMSSDKELVCANYDRIAKFLCDELESGDTALINLGDTGVYSTFSYIAERVAAVGYAAEYVPGVTSFCAASALCGAPLVSGDEVLTVIPYSSPDLSELLERRGTKVVMKSGRHSGELLQLLRSKGLAERTYIAENCGLPTERLLSGAQVDGDTGYFTVFIVK